MAVRPLRVPSGTTLVELLIAMTVASIVVVVAAAALMKGHKASVAARDQAEAAQIIDFITARFQTAKFESVLGAAGGGNLTPYQAGYPNPTLAGSTMSWRNSVAGYTGYPNNYLVRWNISPMRQTLEDILVKVSSAGFTAFKVQMVPVRRDRSDVSNNWSVSDYITFTDASPIDGVDDLDERLSIRDCNNDNDLNDICPDGPEMPATNLRQLIISLYKGQRLVSESVIVVSSEKLTGDTAQMNESALRFEIQYPLNYTFIYQNTLLTRPHLFASNVNAPFFRRHDYTLYIENYGWGGRLYTVMPVDPTPITNVTPYVPGGYSYDMSGYLNHPRHDPFFVIRTEPGNYFEFTYDTQTGFVLGGGTMSASGTESFLVDATPIVSGPDSLQTMLMRERTHSFWGRARHGDQTSPWTRRYAFTDATPPRARDRSDAAFTNPPHGAQVRTRTPIPWIVVVDNPTVAGAAVSGLVTEVASIGTAPSLSPLAINQITYGHHLIRNTVPNPAGQYPKSMEIVMIDTMTMLPYLMPASNEVFLRAEFGDLTYYKSSAPWSYRACVPPTGLGNPDCPNDTWDADPTTPTVRMISPANGATLPINAMPVISFKLADPESGVDPRSVEIGWTFAPLPNPPNPFFNASDLGLQPKPGEAYTFGPDSLPDGVAGSQTGGFTVTFTPSGWPPGNYTVFVKAKNWGNGGMPNDPTSPDAQVSFTLQ